MKKILTVIMMGLTLQGCSQSSGNIKKNTITPHVGGSCEICDAIYESPIPFDQLNEVDTSLNYNESGTKLHLAGIVYKRDGKTPAPDVVIYYYHTNQEGRYPQKGDEKGWGKRHGYLRGWVKSDKDGRYEIYTLRPASYPGRTEAAHIHLVIKEPGFNEYYVEAIEFADDPLLKSINRKPKGGDGVVKVKTVNGIQLATRHIILGLNIDNYPVSKNQTLHSGLAVGTSCPAFDPLHLSGPDKGSKACPMCKYGFGQGLMVWFNHANLSHMNDFAESLESALQKRTDKNTRVFLVYMNPFHEKLSKAEEKIVQKKLTEWAVERNLQKVALVWVPSPTDHETSGKYKLNPDAINTVFLYKKRKVAEKWVNMEYDQQSISTILRML